MSRIIWLCALIEGLDLKSTACLYVCFWIPWSAESLWFTPNYPDRTRLSNKKLWRALLILKTILLIIRLPYTRRFLRIGIPYISTVDWPLIWPISRTPSATCGWMTQSNVTDLYDTPRTPGYVARHGRDRRDKSGPSPSYLSASIADIPLESNTASSC